MVSVLVDDVKFLIDNCALMTTKYSYQYNFRQKVFEMKLFVNYLKTFFHVLQITFRLRDYGIYYPSSRV